MIIDTKNIKKEEADNKIKELVPEQPIEQPIDCAKEHKRSTTMTPEDREFLEDLMLEQLEQM